MSALLLLRYKDQQVVARTIAEEEGPYTVDKCLGVHTLAPAVGCTHRKVTRTEHKVNRVVEEVGSRGLVEHTLVVDSQVVAVDTSAAGTLAAGTLAAGTSVVVAAVAVEEQSPLLGC